MPEQNPYEKAINQQIDKLHMVNLQLKDQVTLPQRFKPILDQYNELQFLKARGNCNSQELVSVKRKVEKVLTSDLYQELKHHILESQSQVQAQAQVQTQHDITEINAVISTQDQDDSSINKKNTQISKQYVFSRQAILDHYLDALEHLILIFPSITIQYAEPLNILKVCIQKLHAANDLHKKNELLNEIYNILPHINPDNTDTSDLTEFITNYQTTKLLKDQPILSSLKSLQLIRNILDPVTQKVLDTHKKFEHDLLTFNNYEDHISPFNINQVSVIAKQIKYKQELLQNLITESQLHTLLTIDTPIETIEQNLEQIEIMLMDLTQHIENVENIKYEVTRLKEELAFQKAKLNNDEQKFSVNLEKIKHISAITTIYHDVLKKQHGLHTILQNHRLKISIFTSEPYMQALQKCMQYKEYVPQAIQELLKAYKCFLADKMLIDQPLYCPKIIKTKIGVINDYIDLFAKNKQMIIYEESKISAEINQWIHNNRNINYFLQQVNSLQEDEISYIRYFHDVEPSCSELLNKLKKIKDIFENHPDRTQEAIHLLPTINRFLNADINQSILKTIQDYLPSFLPKQTNDLNQIAQFNIECSHLTLARDDVDQYIECLKQEITNLKIKNAFYLEKIETNIEKLVQFHDFIGDHQKISLMIRSLVGVEATNQALMDSINNNVVLYGQNNQLQQLCQKYLSAGMINQNQFNTLVENIADQEVNMKKIKIQTQYLNQIFIYLQQTKNNIIKFDEQILVAEKIIKKYPDLTQYINIDKIKIRKNNLEHFYANLCQINMAETATQIEEIIQKIKLYEATLDKTLQEVNYLEKRAIKKDIITAKIHEKTSGYLEEITKMNELLAVINQNTIVYNFNTNISSAALIKKHMHTISTKIHNIQSIPDEILFIFNAQETWVQYLIEEMNLQKTKFILNSTHKIKSENPFAEIIENCYKMIRRPIRFNPIKALTYTGSNLLDDKLQSLKQAIDAVEKEIKRSNENIEIVKKNISCAHIFEEKFRYPMLTVYSFLLKQIENFDYNQYPLAQSEKHKLQNLHDLLEHNKNDYITAVKQNIAQPNQDGSYNVQTQDDIIEKYKAECLNIIRKTHASLKENDTRSWLEKLIHKVIRICKNIFRHSKQSDNAHNFFSANKTEHVYMDKEIDKLLALFEDLSSKTILAKPLII